MKHNILITGGAGFIGSHVVRPFVTKYPEYHIINLDKLTYAGNLANLRDIEDSPNYTFSRKLKDELGSKPSRQFEEGIKKNRPVVPRQSGVDGQHHLGRV